MKYRGKEKCRILKQIRARIAESNDIEWVVEECPHKGDCRGTCPKCEAEVRELEQKLEERRKLGKRIAVAGVAAGIALSVSGCTGTGLGNTGNSQLAGDLAVPDDSSEAVTSCESQGTDGVIEMGEVAFVDTETEGSGDDAANRQGDLIPAAVDETLVAGILLPPDDAEVVTARDGTDPR